MAQVSMNLTDFEQTPIHRVFEFVKREAQRYGCVPVSSEIVGLIPKLALEQAAEWFLQIENFDSSLILENRLDTVMSGKTAVGGLRAGLIAGIAPFIEQLAAPTATPGGGSAAAAAGAMAAGLAVMVASMSRGKKAYLQYESQLSEAIARLTPLGEELKADLSADAESYSVVVKAYKAAKEAKTSGDGNRAINAALRQATSVPLGVAEKAVDVARIANQLKPISNPNMSSDLITAIALAGAALEGALANVAINLHSFHQDLPEDESFVSQTQKRVAELKEQA
jgi:glutamate formiminotransferase/formiminotetrahydrofolate cyclodeaminase